MEASRLTIDPNHLRFDKMTNGRRSKLRRENIKALIRSRPAGSVIRVAEFQNVTQSSNPSTSVMLKNMVKRGEIRRIPDERKPSLSSWAVVETGIVTRKLPEPVAPTVSIVDLDWVLDKAKTFVWGEDSDSLRAFIKWLEEK